MCQNRFLLFQWNSSYLKQNIKCGKKKVRDSHSLEISPAGNRPCGMLLDILQESFCFKLCLCLTNPRGWK